MKTIENLRYAAQSPSQALDIYLPECDAFDVFVYFHGGFLEAGSRDDARHFAGTLTDAGIAVVSADYRLYPEAKYPDFIDDAAAAVACALREMPQYGRVKKSYIGGSSAGGYLSMMLCFDARYLAKYGIDADEIDGYVHDAPQPTCHNRILRERGIDTRRVIVDEAAPLYHVGTREQYPPMLFIVSDNDMENRLEQIQLTLSTLRHFRCDENVDFQLMHGTHCQYVSEQTPGVGNPLGNRIVRFIQAYGGGQRSMKREKSE
jgi:acetyl esterase/lipase